VIYETEIGGRNSLDEKEEGKEEEHDRENERRLRGEALT
jgi:hypothetical protein